MGLACACANDADPSTWVKRLDDPKRKVEAIERLEKFHDDAGTHDALIVAPLAATYAAGGLDDKTRAGLIAALAAMRDVRALPAFAHALDDCTVDVDVAAKGVTALAKSGADLGARVPTSLFGCFARYKPSQGSMTIANALSEALAAVHDASYPAKLAVMLEAPVNPADSLDSHGVHVVNDRLEFWQKSALEVLLAMRDHTYAHEVTLVLMSREKRTLWPLARAVLAASAHESVPVLATALDGSDASFVKMRAGWERDDGWVPNVVQALAETSTDRARDAVLAVVPTLTNDSNRSALAQSLTWFPHTPAIVEAFESIFAKLPAGSLERAALLQVAADLFDVHLFTWALDEAAKSGKGDQAVGARAGAIQTAIRLMQPGDEPRVLDALDVLENKSGLSPMERGEIATNIRAIYTSAASALTQCKVEVACHVAILRETIPPASHANWKAIKAATMCGLLGNDATRKQLVAMIGSVRNPGARLAMLRAINQLAPRGDAADAAVLERVAATEALAPDDDLTRVARMLRARTTP